MNLSDDARAVRELRAAVATARPETIAQTAIHNIWPLFSCAFDELIQAIESLPSTVLERYPTLRAIHPITPVLARTNRPFKPLLYPADADSMSSDELDILLLVQMVTFRFSGDVAAAVIYARRLEERIAGARVDTRERIDGPLWYYHHQIGSTLLAAGDSATALREFATARQIGRISRRPDAERLALGRTALAHAARGSLDDAELALAELELQPRPSPAHESAARATERTARALIAVERWSSDADEACAQLEPYDSLELTWPFALLARARALIADQRADEALEALRLARDAHPDQHGSFASDVIAASTIAALWALDDATAAQHVVEHSSRSGLLTRFAIARHALLAAQPETAARELRQLREIPLGPAQSAELILLTAWLERVRAGSISAEIAVQIARIASRSGARRLLTTVPAQLVAEVRAQLAPDEAETFDAATRTLTFIDAPHRPSLTSSERRVLSALARYATVAEIAVAFHVSPNTVKSQLSSIYRKLGCASREEAVRFASRLHLIDIAEA